MGKQRDARHAGVPELQLAVDAAAAAAAALRCVATAARVGGIAAQRRQMDPTSASALREVLAAAAQSVGTYLRLAESLRLVPAGVGRRLVGVTADAKPVLPDGEAPPAGSDKTTRRAAQRRRQRQRRAAAAPATQPQAAPAQAGTVSLAAERVPPAGSAPRTWAATAAAAPPSALRTATPGWAPPPLDAAMAEARSSGTASADAAMVWFSAGTDGSTPPPRRLAGRNGGRTQPAAAASWRSAAVTAAGGKGGGTGERTPAQRPLGTTPAFRRNPFARQLSREEEAYIARVRTAGYDGYHLDSD